MGIELHRVVCYNIESLIHTFFLLLFSFEFKRIYSNSTNTRLTQSSITWFPLRVSGFGFELVAFFWGVNAKLSECLKSLTIRS